MSFDVAKVLGKDSFSAAEADAILEIAYLTGVANGSFSRDELKSLRRLAHALADLVIDPNAAREGSAADDVDVAAAGAVVEFQRRRPHHRHRFDVIRFREVESWWHA